MRWMYGYTDIEVLLRIHRGSIEGHAGMYVRRVETVGL